MQPIGAIAAVVAFRMTPCNRAPQLHFSLAVNFNSSISALLFSFKAELLLQAKGIKELHLRFLYIPYMCGNGKTFKNLLGDNLCAPLRMYLGEF